MKHRKRCLKEEMNLLEKRKLWSFIILLTDRRSMSQTSYQVWSEVSTTENTSHWMLASRDYRGEYYNNVEEVTKVKFRYNSEKGCFEEEP